MNVHVGVASNVDPEIHVPSALRRLDAHAPILAASPFYLTAPIDRPNQSGYWNGVVIVKTADTHPAELRRALRAIEEAEGRTRAGDNYAAREIDLDILLWGDLIDPASGIPDSDIVERPFLMRCLLDLDPTIQLPGDDRPLAQRLARDAKFTRVELTR